MGMLPKDGTDLVGVDAGLILSSSDDDELLLLRSKEPSSPRTIWKN